jgi:hypothetical protein
MPFSQKQFFEVFANYNEAIWPVPVVAYLFGFIILLGLLLGRPRLQRSAWFLLGALWLWTGGSYFYMHLGKIEPLLRIFGFLFLVQGGALMGYGVNEAYQEAPAGRGRRVLGVLLALTALAIYPLIGAAAGHAYPAAPSFGITPCPLVVFSFGMFLLSPTRIAGWFYVIPAIWAVIGGTATLLLGVAQDILLPLSALAAIAAAGLFGHKSAPSERKLPPARLAGQH